MLGLGAFSETATACCAPVLAGAAALSTTTADVAGGLLLGTAYVARLAAPLAPLALLARRVRGRVPDPSLPLRLGSYAKHLTLSRLLGSIVFASVGLLFVALALTGSSEAAPGFQSLGLWARRLGAYLDDAPNLVALPALVYAATRKGRDPREQV